MRRVVSFFVIYVIVAAQGSASGTTLAPSERSTRDTCVEAYWDASRPATWEKQSAAAPVVWVAVQDDSACSYTGNPLYGSRGRVAPGWAVWCFDGGLGDSCSSTNTYGGGLPGCWTHYDAHVFGQTNQWHNATYDTYLPGIEDSSFWCGQTGDTMTWEWPPGYGPNLNSSLILNLGVPAAFSTANGMTIGGVQLYAIEFAYDFCFVEIAAAGSPDTAQWLEVARFTGVSNPDSINCRGLPQSYWGTTNPFGIGTGTRPYLCADWALFDIRVTTSQLAAIGQNASENLFVRWRASTDLFWDDVTGVGTQSDTRGAWRVDHLSVRGARTGPNSYFPADPARLDNVNFETAGEPGRAQFSTPLLPRGESSGGYWNGSSWVHGKPRTVDLWHLTNTPVYTNQGATCQTSNRWLWASNLTPAGSDGNIDDSGFLYRLASPVFDVSPNSPLTDATLLAGMRVGGIAVHYDTYLCIKATSADVAGVSARVFYGGAQATWDDWQVGGLFIGGCQFWETGALDDWSGLLTATTDSVQFGFDLFDLCNYNSAIPVTCMPGVTTVNPHRKNTFLVDNISVGLGLANTQTVWAGVVFQDTFERGVYLHPPTKENYELYPGDLRESEDSLGVTVSDRDGLQANTVVLHYRISTDCGSSWTHETTRPQGSKAKPALEWFTKILNFSAPGPDAIPGGPTQFNGLYQTTLELNTTDFPGTILSGGQLREGTVVEYYLTARDNGGARDTFPDRHSDVRSFIHPLYGVERQDPWPFETTVLPCRPASAYAAQGGKRILLVDDWFGRTGYDAESDPQLSGLSANAFPRLAQLYEEALRDLNLAYDRYDNMVSQALRTPTLAFYSEPTDKDGFGGIRNPATAGHRYEDVIWTVGRHNQFTVLDSSQLELANYLASDVNEGNLWLAGGNICEDERLSGIAEAFNGGDFWLNYIGASLVSGGCADNAGIAARRFYIEGVNDAAFTPMMLVGGWADCPVRDQPDDGLSVNSAGQGTELAVLQFDNVAHTLNRTSGILDTQPGLPNKVLTTMFGLDNVTTRAARACLTRAVLSRFGVTMPAGSLYTASVCARPTVGVAGDADTPRRFELEQNYPNPFNPSTHIRYSLPRDGMRVQLKIFDASGRGVRTLLDEVQSGASHEVYWDGKDDRGEPVSSGVYFYSLRADTQTETRKLVLVK